MKSLQTRILALATEKKFEKGEFLVKEDKKCNWLFLLQKGIIRYYYTIGAKEITSGFACENDWVTTTSFFTQSAGSENVLALEEVTTFAVSRQKLYQLYADAPETESFGRLMAEQHLLHIESIFLSFSEKSATERYQLFAEAHPHLLQRVPLFYLASYLNMSPETLSRIRAKKL